MKLNKFFKISNFLRKAVLMCCALSLIVTFSSCDDDDDPAVKKPTITVIMGKNGKGNNDYSALIYKAINKWQNNPNVEMKVYFPKTKTEATAIYREWAEKSVNDVKALMVPANGEFAYMVANEKLNLKKNQQVLTFEMDLGKEIEGVHAFELSHAGVSYLSGKMASICDEAITMIGHITPMLQNASDSFHKGFGDEKPFECIEISDSFNGFNMADKAKEIARNHKNAFILPLAGLSNNGVYDFLNECTDNDKAVAAGMDVDCSKLSRRIPFSYIVNIDKAVDLHLQCWYDGKPWPAPKMGLKEGMTGIVFNPDFTETGGLKRSDFENIYKKYWQEAVEMDR